MMLRKSVEINLTNIEHCCLMMTLSKINMC
jgi:hypothetical protein